MAMTLRSLAPKETEVAYRASVDVKGRLAILGEMVLRTTATLIVQEAIRRMRAQLESGATA
jgi:carbon monoxide dehydrogenase subunit G